MNRLLSFALIAMGFMLVPVLPAPMAGAKVNIQNSDSGRQLDTITRGKCRVSGKKGSRDFFLTARSDSGKFNLTVFIDSPVFAGFHEYYIAFYGGGDPQIFLRRRSDDELFSNFKLPGTPAGAVGAGAVAFRRDGRRVGVGLYAASNKSFTEGCSFARALNCKYANRWPMRPDQPSLTTLELGGG